MSTKRYSTRKATPKARAATLHARRARAYKAGATRTTRSGRAAR